MIGVLLVDDEALTLELHRRYVERVDGFRVVGECGHARAAVAAVLDDNRRSQIDLVLLDITMPDGTGVDVLRHIRARGSDVDVIAVTGVRDADTVRRMASLGVAQYLVKPFSFATFRERLERYREVRARTQAAATVPTQSEIDELLGAQRPAPAPPSLPKGLSVDTLGAIEQHIRTRGPLSAREAAEGVGMSRVSTRRYLEHLADTGLVVRSPRYGTPGRPEVEYRWNG
ncbi:response regulator [Microbacterium sp. ARD31]|uniref:response regulator n=1 Tax=Microbacterium sp. ARD31 TaxID=2962576 RepID=UPI002881996E|nr:response regulator [Microbacterium sp. ARD31]MDT0186227.1 response regulator [Microbacterium sp. ARD31]